MLTQAATAAGLLAALTEIDPALSRTVLGAVPHGVVRDGLAKARQAADPVLEGHDYGDHAAEPTPEGLNTRNFERLRASGVTFTRGDVSAPICSPSRAG